MAPLQAGKGIIAGFLIEWACMKVQNGALYGAQIKIRACEEP